MNSVILFPRKGITFFKITKKYDIITNDEVNDMLKCPKCGSELIKEERNYRCCNDHCFDIAKRGYVNLVLGSSKATGDDKEMVKSRTRFLHHGYYENLQNRLIEIIQMLQPSMLVDAGCGEGYYTNAIKQSATDIELYGFDLSKYAIDEACKAHCGVIYGVCNVFHLPLEDHNADTVLSVFAPIDINENSRVLKPGGYFIKVGPGPKHLYQLKEELYSDVYDNEIKTGYEGYELVSDEILHNSIDITDSEDIWALFQMTPYYWRTPKKQAEKLKSLTSLHTITEFHISVYRKEC